MYLGLFESYCVLYVAANVIKNVILHRHGVIFGRRILCPPYAATTDMAAAPANAYCESKLIASMYRLA